MTKTSKKISLSTKVKVPQGYQLRTYLTSKPKKVKEPNSRESYPFSQMELNSSFFVPNKTARELRGAIYGATHRYNHQYIARSTVGGSRVWRVV